MRQGWQLIFRWERSALGDEPKRRIRWAPIIVTLALIAGALSIVSYLLTPAAPAPAPVAHIAPAPKVTVTAQPITDVSLRSSRTGALCIVPTGKPGKRTVVVRVP